MEQRHVWVLGALLLLTTAGGQLHAQSPRIWIGARGGIDIGSLSFDPDTISGLTHGSTTGIAIGAEFDYWFSDHFGVSAQPSYVQKGGTTDQTFTLFGTSYKYSSSYNGSYFEIPILFKISFGSGNVRPMVFIGPEIGFKLSAKQRVTTSVTDSTIDIPDSDITSINFGIIGGVGATYNVSPTTMIFLEAAYDYGLTNLNAQYGKDLGGGEVDNQKIFTRDFRITLGVLFGFGKQSE